MSDLRICGAATKMKKKHVSRSNDISSLLLRCRFKEYYCESGIPLLKLRLLRLKVPLSSQDYQGTIYIWKVEISDPNCNLDRFD